MLKNISKSLRIIPSISGFTGKIKISENNYDPKNGKINVVETYGINAVGAFGTGKPISSIFLERMILVLKVKSLKTK